LDHRAAGSAAAALDQPSRLLLAQNPPDQVPADRLTAISEIL